MVNAENLSAQEASAQQGAWLPQENVYEEWPQGAGSPSCKGPQAADPVIFAHSAAQKKKQIEPPNMSGSFFYRPASVRPGGRNFRPAAPSPGPSDPSTVSTSVPTLTAAGRPRRANIAFPDSARRERARASARFPLTKKRTNASDFSEQTHEENLCDQTKS